MTELEKMKAYHIMEEIKNTPQWMQDFNLVKLCEFDKTGRSEKIARILAAHKMPTNEIVPCLMDIMQDFLVEIEADGESYVTGQSN